MQILVDWWQFFHAIFIIKKRIIPRTPRKSRVGHPRKKQQGTSLSLQSDQLDSNIEMEPLGFFRKCEYIRQKGLQHLRMERFIRWINFAGVASPPAKTDAILLSISDSNSLMDLVFSAGWSFRGPDSAFFHDFLNESSSALFAHGRLPQ